jgi:hypothetical protein
MHCILLVGKFKVTAETLPPAETAAVEETKWNMAGYVLDEGTFANWFEKLW